MHIIKNTTSLVLSSIVLALFTMTPVLAASNASTTAGTARASLQEKQMQRIVSRSNQEIDRRVKALAVLSSRIQSMNRLSDAEKATITSELQAQTDALNSLKTKIAAETDSATLRADAQLIAKSYRIFALIIPQSHIMVAADRVAGIADAMEKVELKLQTRVDAEKAAGKDMSAAQLALADMTARIADAKAKTQEAQSIVAPLVPDQGDQAKFKANKEALKLAQSKIRAAHQALVLARHDMQTVMQALRITGEDKDRPATSTDDVKGQ